MYKYLLLILLLAGCVKSPFSDRDIKETVDRLDVLSSITVIPKEGEITTVMWGEDTLAVLSSKANIVIPKLSVNGNLLRINEEPLKECETYSRYWQAVAFEDSKRGDYDYNDLVIHVRNVCNRPWNKDYIEQSITIQPIALGGTVDITLGFILSDLTEHIVSTNVRKDLFNSKEGFINTTGDPIRYKLDNDALTNYRLDKDNTPWVAWFIEVEGERLYAISSEIPTKVYDMLNSDGMPYGLVKYSTFAYPNEKTSMFTAYPDFKGWINGDKSNLGSGLKPHLYDSNKLWDYQDL